MTSATARHLWRKFLQSFQVASEDPEATGKELLDKTQKELSNIEGEGKANEAIEAFRYYYGLADGHPLSDRNDVRLFELAMEFGVYEVAHTKAAKMFKVVAMTYKMDVSSGSKTAIMGPHDEEHRQTAFELTKELEFSRRSMSDELE